MRNILSDSPGADLHGIPLQAARLVADEDLRDRDVLDIGCGFGWFELLALSKGVRKIIGIEITSRDLETAQKHVNAANVRFEVASAISLPFEDECFDTIVCWEVLEHIPRDTEPRAFSEFHRVLRPGGTLYLSTPHAALPSKILDPAWWLIGHRHYSTETLRRLSHEAGLSVELLDVRGGAWLIASILNLYIAKWVFRRGPFCQRYFNQEVDREMAGGGGCRRSG
jgi:2-polyprenyl-3-methyl-5-hydroxy-6-metoxy-1,4-benzoquinol methylase